MSRAFLLQALVHIAQPSKRNIFLFIFIHNCWGNYLLEGSLAVLGSLSELGLCELSVEVTISLIGRGVREKENERKETQEILLMK